MSKLGQLPMSVQELVQLSLQQQGLLQFQRGKTGTLAAIEQLGYVQIDSINVVERAHHHVLHSRVSDYQPQWLDALMAEKQIFEYWSHAAAYLPMSEFRFSLYRKQQLAAGKKHWFAADHQEMRQVRAKLQAEGPLKASDFEKSQDKNGAWWDWQPAKRALEQLYMQGELMVVRRDKFQKVYDFTEHVLPSNVDCTVPSTQEYAEHLIGKFLQSHAFGTVGQISYLRPEMKKPVQQQLMVMQDAGVVASFNYAQQQYFWDPALETRVQKSSQLQLLNPFDNFVIQRQRLQHWLNFDYQIEVYVPAVKRKVGYYSLPILYQGRMIGQLDVKADRQHGVLLLQHLLFMPDVNLTETLARALYDALQAYAKFNGCVQWQLVKANSKVQAWFAREIGELRG